MQAALVINLMLQPGEDAICVYVNKDGIPVSVILTDEFIARYPVGPRITEIRGPTAFFYLRLRGLSFRIRSVFDNSATATCAAQPTLTSDEHRRRA